MVTGDVVLLVGVTRQVEQQLLGQAVEAVVVGAKVDPAVPEDGALADVGALTDDHLVAAGVGAAGDGGGVGLAVPERLGFPAEEIHKRGGEIDVVVEF